MKHACYMYAFQGDREMRAACPRCLEEIWINRDMMRQLEPDWIGICPRCGQRCVCVNDRHMSAELAVFEEAAWATP